MSQFAAIFNEQCSHTAATLACILAGEMRRQDLLNDDAKEAISTLLNGLGATAKGYPNGNPSAFVDTLRSLTAGAEWRA